jgi:protein TonB
MDINKILTADVLDLIFEGRYKEYGAYELRKSYNQRLKNALIVMVALTVLLAGGAIWSNSAKKSKTEIIVQDVNLTDVNNQEKKPPPPPPPPPPPKQEPPKVELAKFTPPKIVKDEEVKKEDEIKEQDKLEDVKISSIDQEGVKVDVTAPVEVSTGPVGPPAEETDVIFTSVQIQSTFPGGTEAWVKFLSRTLNRDLPVENGAPSGRYSVSVSFVVARDGSISDVKAENDPGYGTAAEAVRVIQKGPKWIPAEQNGHKVIYRHRQAIVFQVTED